MGAGRAGLAGYDRRRRGRGAGAADPERHSSRASGRRGAGLRLHRGGSDLRPPDAGGDGNRHRQEIAVPDARPRGLDRGERRAGGEGRRDARRGRSHEDAERAARRARRHGEEDSRVRRRDARGGRVDPGICIRKKECAMAFRKRREALRSILSSPRCIRPGSVYDAISIRIAEDLGFEVGMFGGSVASLAVLGDPDIALITLTELAEQMRRMLRAAALPVLVDADHGYGNALNVRRTVQELEAAGAGGLTIEDTLLPQAFGEKKT